MPHVTSSPAAPSPTKRPRGRPHGIIAPTELRARVRRLVADVGMLRAAGMLDVGREAVARICAGLGNQPGTLRIVEDSLNDLPAQYRAA